MNSPLFSNDFVGLAKFLAIMLTTVLLPLGALVVYFLKRSDVAKETATQKDIDGLGARVSAVEQSVTKLVENVAAVHTTIHNGQRDIMATIRAMGETQTKAVHEIDKEVAVLKERNDLGDCIQQFGKSIERLVGRLTPSTGMERRDD